MSVMLPSELPQPLAEGNEFWSCLKQIFNLSVAHALYSTQSLSKRREHVGYLQKRCVRNANPLQQTYVTLKTMSLLGAWRNHSLGLRPYPRTSFAYLHGLFTEVVDQFTQNTMHLFEVVV